MAKHKQGTGPSPELTTSSRKALLELLGDVLKAQETKPDELKAKQQRLVELLRRDAGKKT
jgi:hypothetical protein